VKRFAADLHIHTALSPCASKDMTPRAIADAAIRRRLAVIAICDHNAAGNIAATREAAGDRIAVLAGIEIMTAEEAHVVGLFPSVEAAVATAEEVRAVLPDTTEAASRKFGEALLMNANGDIVGTDPKMLSAATSFPLSETVKLIQKHGGLAIAAHVDRPSFSVISQLGMFPEDVVFDAIELSTAPSSLSSAARLAGLGLPMIRSSDSHFLNNIGDAFTVFQMREPTFSELALALKGVSGRRCCRA